MEWRIRHQKLRLDRPLVMGILNVTPDSFSDGGRFFSIDDALSQAERMITDGADIIDIGGESTRPGSKRITAEEEVDRVVPVIEQISQRLDIPISVDTTRSMVARAAIRAGASIINDISGLRFDEDIARVTAEADSGLVLMHSRGEFEKMHSQPSVDDIFAEVVGGLHGSIKTAGIYGVQDDQITLDVGIGFGKTQAQNLELIAKLDKLRAEFPAYPFLVGASRKSFIGKLLGGAAADERLTGSLALAVIAAWNGANILRVHDVKETVETLKVVKALTDNL